ASVCPGAHPVSAEAGSAPDRQPPTELGLHRQVVLDQSPYLQFQRVVAPLVTVGSERVERAALVQVHQCERLALRGGERDQRAQQGGAEPVVLQGGVDRVQIGHQVGHL